MVVTALCVFWALVLSGAVAGALIVSRHEVKTRWSLAAVVLMALLLRIGTDGPFFGLEYEDAYVYAAASRYLAATGSSLGFGGLTVCAIGSHTVCADSEFYPGHLPGFSAFLYAVESMVGQGIWVPPLVGAVLSSAASVAVWWAAFGIYQSSAAAAVAGTLFAVTPVLVLYGGSATSESASGLPFAVSIAAATMSRRSTSVRAWWAWHGLGLVAVMLAISVRRENVALAAVVPAMLLMSNPASISRKAMWWALLSWIVVGVGAVGLIVPSVVSEVGEYGNFSFGFWRVLDTLPVIARALVAPYWFGLVPILALLGLCCVLIPSQQGDATRDDAMLIAIAGTVLCSLVLYGSHVRSTYQLMGVAVQPNDFLRYLANIGVSLCLLTPAAGRLVAVPRLRSSVTLVVACCYVLLSAGASWSLRSDMLADERFVRTDPAVGAVAAAAADGNRRPIVTLEPLVVQLYSRRDTVVVGLPELTPERVADMGGRVLYVRQDHYQTPENQRRYEAMLSALPTVGSQVELRTGPGWAVIQMGGR